MLNFLARRILYTIPVVLIASFLLFVFVRATFDPTAKLRAGRADAGAVAREKERLGLDQPGRRPVRRTGSASSCAATGVRASAPARTSSR